MSSNDDAQHGWINHIIKRTKKENTSRTPNIGENASYNYSVPYQTRIGLLKSGKNALQSSKSRSAPDIKESSALASTSSTHLLSSCDRRTDEILYQKILRRAKREFEYKWNNIRASPIGKIDDYYLKRTLGQGSFGRVVHVIYKETGKSYAMKILKKNSIVRKQQIQQVIIERKILSSLDYPFIIKLLYSFQDSSNLYMVLQLISGGEMYFHLKRKGRFSESLSKFYASQVILSLEYMHTLDLAYRDLKPENILIDYRGYIKIVDFGFTKQVAGRTYTFCGTPDYMAPEVLVNKGYGKEVDWWGVGVLIYEMITGTAPFSPIGNGFFLSNESTMSNILACRYKLPKYLAGSKVADLIRGLLQTNPCLRLGVLESDARDIIHHPWFDSTDWLGTYRKTIIPEFKPCSGPDDLRNFKNIAKEKPIEISGTMEYPRLFIDF